jgi:hypothetical protein
MEIKAGKFYFSPFSFEREKSDPKRHTKKNGVLFWQRFIMVVEVINFNNCW